MTLQRLSLFLCALCLPWLAQAQTTSQTSVQSQTQNQTARAPIRLSYLYSDGNIPGTLQAFEELLEEHPELRDQVQLELLTESTFDEVKPETLESSNVLVLDVMNEQMLQKFNTQNKTDLVKQIGTRGTVLGVGQGLQSEDAYRAMGMQFDQQARTYWEHSGANNRLGLMKLALSRAGVKGLDLPRPEQSLDFGYYYPDGRNGRVFADWPSFDAWRAANGKKRAGAPRVAISFFKATYYGGDAALLNALIAEVERQGAEAIPVFGYPGAVSVQRLLLDEQQQARADVVLGSNFNFSDQEAAKLLDKVDIPVINLITLYGRSEVDWRNSNTGLSLFEGTFNLATPELAGTTAPTVVGTKEKVRDPLTGLNSVITSPIKSQVGVAVSRGLRYANLRLKANADKNLAVLYYNYPPGKANIGASYLNVAESLANMLASLKAAGYDVGDHVPNADEVLSDITTKARNVAGDAPGELEEMLAAGNAVRVPMSEYRQWLNNYAPSLRNKILKDWGEPEQTKLMTAKEAQGVNQGFSFVIPVVKYGKVLLTPQPSRAWGEDLDKLYHAKDLAPHHQYVATYAWLRNGFKADAVVHVGTHGTLEWLDGKDTGLNEEDAPDALIADLPDVYIYNVDVVGEGLVARRRGMATLVDHMTPPFKEGGLTEELAKLSELMNDHTQNETKNPELAEIYGRQVREQAIKLGITKDIGLPMDRNWTHEQLHQVEDYLLELKKQIIPYGLHAFGRTPETALRDSTVQAIVSVDRSLLPDTKKVLSDEMAQRIDASGPRELDSLLQALGGRFVSAGSGGEPVRNPDSYATGNNFYGIDPDKVPKPAAWEMGVKLADQMLKEHLEKNGKYPEKVSFVIWGDETMRHEGVMESQIFHLLGTKPIWNARGKVVGVEVIPRAQLGRPRVDIVIASASEGLFNNVTRLMDEAVQKVKALDEADNLVRKHYLATKAALIKQGRSPEEADKLAGVRIFDEPPGTYNLNTSSIVAASGSWDSEAGFANDYIRKMGHGYGNGYWGESMEDVFRLALSGVEKVVHSNSTMLYGTLDNDDMFMYMGGLAAAVRSIDGSTPDTVITNSRDPGKPEMTSLDKFIGTEFRSRYVNAEWIRGMQKEGYAGAGEMKAFIEYLWGWDATVTSAVDDRMWQETFETYVEDKQNLGMKQFFDSKSPFAYQDITARMLETVRKDYWKADQQTKTKLLQEYIDSINQHGVSCAEHTCGNGRLLEYVMQEAKAAGIPTPALDSARAALEKAIGKKIEVAAQQLRDFAQRNDAAENAERAQGQAQVAAARAAAQADQQASQKPSQQAAKQEAPVPETAEAAPNKLQSMLEGFLMEQEDRSNQQSNATTTSAQGSRWDILWLALPLLGLLLGWRRYNSSQGSSRDSDMHHA
ncbi:MAG: cobaltochelatase subunit CobN [Steroidobacteraceae bacterium]